MVEQNTKGDPESPLLWTSKSTLKLSEELTAQELCAMDPVLSVIVMIGLHDKKKLSSPNEQGKANICA